MILKAISRSSNLLWIYIIFITVQGFDRSSARADFSFSGKNLETRLSAPESRLRENPPPVIQCAKALCSDIPLELTYVSQVERIHQKALTSDFFDQKILPGLLEHRHRQQQEMASLQGYVQFLYAQKAPLKFPEAFRNFYAFPILTQRVMSEVTAIDGSWDFSGSGVEIDSINLKGNTINALAFHEKKRKGQLEGLSFDFASDYIRLRNTNHTSLLSMNPLEETIAIHGKGAKTHILSLFQSALRFLEETLPKNDPAQLIDLQRYLRSDMYIVSSYFETLTSISSISNFSNTYLQRLSHALMLSEIYLLIDKYDAAEPIAVPKDIPVASLHELAREFYKTTQNAETFLEEERFTALVGKQCRWKLNYLHEALPTEEELKVSQQNATKAIINFQGWLFQSFSTETASEIFAFLKDWQFFFPPSKQQFESFLKDLTNPEPRFLRDGFDPRLYSFLSFNNLKSLEQGSFAVPFEKSGFNAFRPVLKFCEGLQLNPISDRVNLNGQVKLGWMTVRTPELLESVVWHELAHTLSSLATGRHFNYIKSVLGQNQTFHFSFDSFDKFSNSRQCVGNMQDQNTKQETIYEPYLTWFKNGRLKKYEIPIPDFEKPSGFGFSEDRGVKTASMHLRPNHRIQDILAMAENSEIDERDKDIVSKIYQSEALIFYDGVFVEEDWADLVAATIGRGKSNHFCYLTKGQESTLTAPIPESTHQKETVTGLTDVPELISTNPKEIREALNSLKAPKYHSPLAYRLLHTEMIRSQNIPRACHEYLSEQKKHFRLTKCDVF